MSFFFFSSFFGCSVFNRRRYLYGTHETFFLELFKFFSQLILFLSIFRLHTSHSYQVSVDGTTSILLVSTFLLYGLLDFFRFPLLALAFWFFGFLIGVHRLTSNVTPGTVKYLLLFILAF